MGILDRVFDFLSPQSNWVKEHNEKILNSTIKVRKATTMNYKEILYLIFTDTLEKEVKKFSILDIRPILDFQELVQDNFNEQAEMLFDKWCKIKAEKQFMNERYEIFRNEDYKYREFLFKIEHQRFTLNELKQYMTKELGNSLGMDRRFSSLKWMIKDAEMRDVQLLGQVA